MKSWAVWASWTQPCQDITLLPLSSSHRPLYSALFYYHLHMPHITANTWSTSMSEHVTLPLECQAADGSAWAKHGKRWLQHEMDSAQKVSLQLQCPPKSCTHLIIHSWGYSVTGQGTWEYAGGKIPGMTSRWPSRSLPARSFRRKGTEPIQENGSQQETNIPTK